MPKIKVFMTLKNKQTSEILKAFYGGILTKEKIVYQEENKIVTIFKDHNKIKMIRKDQNDIIYLTFQKGKIEKGFYEVKQKKFEFVVKTSLLEFDHEMLHICYQTKIEDEIMGDFDFKLHFEVIK